jgi:nitroimidazol reductase NimA-like FMN-containing flavoprotein (pyridoxamine 5'-phosphate oxidase superfamily)
MVHGHRIYHRASLRRAPGREDLRPYAAVRARAHDELVEDAFEICVEELSEDACWSLLGRVRFGRVGLARDGDVVILPVNVAVSRRRLIFRTVAGGTLASMPDGATVAFEADHTVDVAESGWSVLVRGRLRDATGSAEAAAWSELDVHPWAPPPRDRWMVIDATEITGRSIQRHRIARDGAHLPYMAPD